MLNVTIYLDGGHQIVIHKNTDLTPQQYGQQIVANIAEATRTGDDILIPDDLTGAFHQVKSRRLSGISVAHMTHEDAAAAY